MATKTDTLTKPLKIGDRVVATHDFRGIAEGTTGRLRVVDGLAAPRYWVQWENDEWMGNVHAVDVVRQSEWEAYKVRRAEEALRPKVEVKAEAAPAAASGGDGGGAAGAGRVPAHLLERSQKARARKATGGAEGG
ncbi:MAG: hypothetical protein QOF60_2194 [Actinomycetota bacterium]|jgi:hypothetical protein|nr:hypothetical protein [Actinomycetota bacterium]